MAIKTFIWPDDGKTYTFDTETGAFTKDGAPLGGREAASLMELINARISNNMLDQKTYGGPTMAELSAKSRAISQAAATDQSIATINYNGKQVEVREAPNGGLEIKSGFFGGWSPVEDSVTKKLAQEAIAAKKVPTAGDTTAQTATATVPAAMQGLKASYDENELATNWKSLRQGEDGIYYAAQGNGGFIKLTKGADGKYVPSPSDEKTYNSAKAGTTPGGGGGGGGGGVTTPTSRTGGKIGRWVQLYDMIWNALADVYHKAWTDWDTNQVRAKGDYDGGAEQLIARFGLENNAKWKKWIDWARVEKAVPGGGSVAPTPTPTAQTSGGRLTTQQIGELDAAGFTTKDKQKLEQMIQIGAADVGTWDVNWDGMGKIEKRKDEIARRILAQAKQGANASGGNLNLMGNFKIDPASFFKDQNGQKKTGPLDFGFNINDVENAIGSTGSPPAISSESENTVPNASSESENTVPPAAVSPIGAREISDEIAKKYALAYAKGGGDGILDNGSKYRLTKNGDKWNIIVTKPGEELPPATTTAPAPASSSGTRPPRTKGFRAEVQPKAEGGYVNGNIKDALLSQRFVN